MDIVWQKVCSCAELFYDRRRLSKDTAGLRSVTDKGGETEKCSLIQASVKSRMKVENKGKVYR